MESTKPINYKSDYKDYCLICKDFADKRYSITVKDEKLNITTEANLCLFCYTKFIEASKAGKLMKFLKWCKNMTREI